LLKQLGLKTETGLFEWLESKKLQYITDIIDALASGLCAADIIKGVDKHIYLLHEHLYTFHYDVAPYADIFTRRAARFLELVRNGSELLFVRINTLVAEDTTIEELNGLCAALRRINPGLLIKFLLIQTVFDDDDLVILDSGLLMEGVTLIQRHFYYADCKDDVYLRNNPGICRQFAEFLQEAGIEIC